MDVASSICADRAITMKKKGLESTREEGGSGRGRRARARKNATNEGKGRTERRDETKMLPRQIRSQAPSRRRRSKTVSQSVSRSVTQRSNRHVESRKADGESRSRWSDNLISMFAGGKYTRHAHNARRNYERTNERTRTGRNSAAVRLGSGWLAPMGALCAPSALPPSLPFYLSATHDNSEHRARARNVKFMQNR